MWCLWLQPQRVLHMLEESTMWRGHFLFTSHLEKWEYIIYLKIFFSICLNVLQQGVASQYSYSASSYAGQQAAAPSSAASAAYGQPQAYAQPGYAPQAYQVSHLHDLSLYVWGPLQEMTFVLLPACQHLLRLSHIPKLKQVHCKILGIVT